MIIKPAQRTEQIQEYYFSKKLQEIEQLNAKGLSVINLGIGSPDMPPSPKVIDVLRTTALNPNNHSYQSYKGIKELRDAFAKWYSNCYNVELNSDKEIQLLAGSKEGILLLSLAFLNSGDKVLIPNPGYPTYSSATLLSGAEIISYDLLESNDWQPDFEALEKMDLSGVKIMWANYPNMPTGAKATPALYEKLIDFGTRHNILICNDNPYSFLLTETPLSILSIEGAKECCIELNSLSKTFNMAGWRVGMIAGNEHVISNVLKVKSNMDSGMFKPLQLAAVEALSLGKDWFKELNSEYRKRQELAGEIFNMLDVSYDKNSGGMFLWGKISDSWSNGEQLSDFLLNKAHVFITPGFIFGNNADKYIRISLCSDIPTLTKSIERIKKSIVSLTNQ